MELSPEKKLFLALRKNRLTLAVCESCSGGEFASRITNIPGSSKVFLLGIVAYSNLTKNKILKVPLKVILKYGAVSAAAAGIMAENIRGLAESRLGVGITGIAGPGGWTKTKPVGTVFIAAASKNKTWIQKFNFPGTRLEIKKKAVNKAMDMLLKFLKCAPL